jgi:hypothetical protein
MAVAPAQLVNIRAGARGSGWAVGATGVLTARHVVEPYLANPFDAKTNPNGVRCRAVASGPAAVTSFQCDVLWSNQALDLALLRIVAGRRRGRSGWLMRQRRCSPTRAPTH